MGKDWPQLLLILVLIELESSVDEFAAGTKPDTSLFSRCNETLRGLSYLLDTQDYDETICDKLRYYHPSEVLKLDPRRCIGFHVDPEGYGRTGCSIAVTSEDALDVAKRWHAACINCDGLPDRTDRVLVLNMSHPGKGLGNRWMIGGQGSEEELCYRTSFALTFPKDEEGLEAPGVGYSRQVVVIREGRANGHAWCDMSQPDHLFVVSIVSVFCNPRPELTQTTPVRFANASDRSEMQETWRNVLRIAGKNSHYRLVLGMPGIEHQDPAPVEEIADCLDEVMKETEFEGGWFERVTIAVPERQTDFEKVAHRLHRKIYG